MDEPERTTQEDNIQRLVQAGMGHAARPSSGLRAQTLGRLRSEQRRLYPAPDFPAVVLSLILLVGLGMGLAVSGIFGGRPTPGADVIAAILALNLACAPVASIVIITRRKHVA